MERLTIEVPSDDDDDIRSTAPGLLDSPLSLRPKSPIQSHKLSYGDAVALLISLQIGSGVFSSPSQVNRHTPSPGYALLVWLVSGLLAWTGAACYAELGTTLPVSGGTQEYLKYMYGDGIALLASWIWILGVKASGMAALSIIATQYLLSFMFGPSIPSNGWQCKVMALTIYYVIVAINMLSMDVTKAINKFMSILKLSTLALLLIGAFCGIVFGLNLGDEPLGRDWLTKDWFGTINTDWTPGIASSVGEYTLAIYAGLWAFSGWDNVNMVTGDLQDASRTLPNAIHTSQPVVIVSFLVANVCYYMTIPWSEIDINNTIAVTAGRIIFGWVGSLLFAVLVSMACLGSVSINVFTASRLVVSAAQADWLPRYFEKFSAVSVRRSQSRARLNSASTLTVTQSPEQIPVRAMLFMACLVSIYILSGSFGSLITFIGLAEYVFFAATTIGLVILRVREPNLPRPYKPTIIIPVIFSSVSSFLVLVGIVKAPAQATLLGFLLFIGFIRQWSGTQALWDRLSKKRRDSNLGSYAGLGSSSPIDRRVA